MTDAHPIRLDSGCLFAVVSLNFAAGGLVGLDSGFLLVLVPFHPAAAPEPFWLVARTL